MPCEDSQLAAGKAAEYLLPPVLRNIKDHEVAPIINAEDVAVIAMDMSSSTELMNTVGLSCYMSLQGRLFNTLQHIVQSELFPLVQLHEVLGDSFVLTINASWWTKLHVDNIPLFSVTVARYLVAQLQGVCGEEHATRSVQSGPRVHLRAGVAWGKVRATLSGARFRLYSPVMNLAARYESQCPADCVMAQSTPGLLCRLRGDTVTNSTVDQVQLTLKGFAAPQHALQVSLDPSMVLQDVHDVLCHQKSFA